MSKASEGIKKKQKQDWGLSDDVRDVLLTKRPFGKDPILLGETSEELAVTAEQEAAEEEANRRSYLDVAGNIGGSTYMGARSVSQTPSTLLTAKRKPKKLAGGGRAYGVV